MLTTGPFTLTTNVLQTLAGPYTGTPNAVAVQVQNVSGFQLLVTSAGSVYSIPPLTSATIPVDETQTVVVDPITALTNAGELLLVWLLHNEKSPTPDGAIGSPITSISGPVTATISGTVTVTGTVSIGNTPSVTITGTPNVNIANTPSVTISSGTVNVGTVSGTVTISGTVSIGNTPSVTIASGTVNIGTISGTVTISGGPVNVQNVSGTVLATGDAVDYIGGFTVTGSTDAPSGSLTLSKSYSALLVHVAPGTSTSIAECVAVSGFSGAGTTHRFVAPCQPAPLTTSLGFYQTIIPNANEPGDSRTITAYLSAASVNNVVNVYGLTTLPVVPRADGRTPAIGTFGVAFQWNFTGTLVAAPTTPRRIMLKTIVPAAAFSTTGTVAGDITATVKGVTVPIFAAAAGTTGGALQGGPVDFGDGLLLDPGTGISQTTGAAVTNGYPGLIVYDIVV